MTIINEYYPLDGFDDWARYDNDGAFVDILKGWEQSGKQKYLEHVKRFDTVVQAGGYCGIYPRLLANHFRAVYTFEPDAINFYLLNLNCNDGKGSILENVIKFQAALGSHSEMVSVQHNNATNYGMHTVQHTLGSIVPTLVIDDLHLPSCDLMILDVEGGEYSILTGAIHTIDQYRPVISVEDTNSRIEDLLKEFGYKLRSVSFRDTIYAV